MTWRFPFSPSLEPARTILFWVSVLTCIMQVGLIVFHGISPFVLVTAPIVLGGCAWGAYTSFMNDLDNMSRASFLLFGLWMFAGTRRLFVTAPDPTLLLWVPMLIIAVCMGVIYLYLRNMKKTGKDE